MSSSSRPFQLDRTAFSIGRLEDKSDEVTFWRRQPAERRMAGIEFLRRQFYRYGDLGPEFCRLLEIAQCPRR